MPRPAFASQEQSSPGWVILWGANPGGWAAKCGIRWAPVDSMADEKGAP